jgi:hypothetical protein
MLAKLPEVTIVRSVAVRLESPTCEGPHLGASPEGSFQELLKKSAHSTVSS